MDKEVVFSSTTDRFNRNLARAVLIGMPLFSLGIAVAGSTGLGWYLFLGITVFIWAIVWYFSSLLPRRIVVTPQEILLDSRLRPKTIRRDQIVKVRRFFPDELNGLWRKWGANGCYGHWGLHACRAYPKLYVYARRQPKVWILIQTRERCYAVSPDDGDAFVRYLEED